MSPNQMKSYEALAALVGQYIAVKLVERLPLAIIDQLTARIRAELKEAEQRGRLSVLNDAVFGA